MRVVCFLLPITFILPAGLSSLCEFRNPKTGLELLFFYLKAKTKTKHTVLAH